MPENRMLSNARRLRRDMTPWERRLWYMFLRKHPIHIYRQRVIGPYIVDFYCDTAKLAIELDGSQHYMEDEIEYDRARTAYLMRRGIEVLRFPNVEVDRHFPEVCEQIDRVIKTQMGRK